MPSKFDPDLHHRRSIRLADWDYRSPAAYFVTICTHERAPHFADDAVRTVAESLWQALPRRHGADRLMLDAWVVMPDHVHGILMLAPRSAHESPPAAGDTASEIPWPPLANAMAGSVASIVGGYKTEVARRVNSLRRTPSAPVWQRGFYDRILRSPEELDRIRAYIRDNPGRWAERHGSVGEVCVPIDGGPIKS